MNAMASQGRSPHAQYQQHQQAYNVDGHQVINNYRHPGKLVDSKSLQRNRPAGLNGGSGVRVVFLGAASGRESGGTGVFLPRTFTNAPEHKKKNGELLALVTLPLRLIDVLGSDFSILIEYMRCILYILIVVLF